MKINSIKTLQTLNIFSKMISCLSTVGYGDGLETNTSRRGKKCEAGRGTFFTRVYALH